MNDKSEKDSQMPQGTSTEDRKDLIALGGFRTAFIILAILTAGFLLALALRMLVL